MGSLDKGIVFMVYWVNHFAQYRCDLTLVLTSGEIDPFSIFVLYQKIWDVEISTENV